MLLACCPTVWRFPPLRYLIYPDSLTRDLNGFAGDDDDSGK